MNRISKAFEDKKAFIVGEIIKGEKGVTLV